MTNTFTFALDAMGGDRAPESILRGANIARERHPNLRFKVYGDSARLEPILKKLPKLRAITDITHCALSIPDDLKAAQALRLGADSSMRRAIEAVKKGEAQAIISAGNTGALMALSKMLLGSVPGIHRPAITAFFPTESNECVLLDLGANVVCSADNLVQFALMGHVFGEAVLGWKRPRIALLNVGTEHQKGRDEIRDAAARLQSNPALNYVGFIEANHIPQGRADVVVTDGFSGNIALKMAEGTASLVSDYFRQAFRYSWLVKIGYLFIRPAFNKLRARLDPRRYNGAVFLGLKHICIKSHGRTDALGFAAAIDVAVDMHQQQTIAKLSSLIEAQQPTQSIEASAL
ncbi:MAG: phosphate acyltransferase PlsX [Holosporales bacterium]